MPADFEMVTLPMASFLPVVLSWALLRTAAAAHAGDVIKVLPLPHSLARYKKYFSKYIPVFGVPILAEAGVPDWMVEHAGHIMAQYLDYTADGKVANEEVISSMLKQRATLVMFVDPDSSKAQKAADAVGDGGQDLDVVDIPPWAPHPPNATSVHPARALYATRSPSPCSAAGARRKRHHGAVRHCGGPSNADDFDAALEEILHLITDHGYAKVYPEVFGTDERQHSKLAATMNAMVADCGWAFNHSFTYPTCSGRYHYGDETCEYSCLVTEYTMWSLTSVLGGQDGSHNDALQSRCKDIGNEWEMCSKAMLKRDNRVAFDIYDVDGANRYKVPSTLPDGVYKPRALPSAHAMALSPLYAEVTHMYLDGQLIALGSVGVYNSDDAAVYV